MSQPYDLCGSFLVRWEESRDNEKYSKLQKSLFKTDYAWTKLPKIWVPEKDGEVDNQGNVKTTVVYRMS